MRNPLVLILVALVSLTATTQIAAQPKVELVPAPYTVPADGKAMFVTYCASCHGLEGKGDGPASVAMKNGVPDLRLLSKSHGGSFPAFRVQDTIVGNDKLMAHGSYEMPVWGHVFRHLDQQSDAKINLRIHNLTAYVQSLQQK